MNVHRRHRSRPRVLRWGPYPDRGGAFGGGIGGYARYNSQAFRSSLTGRVDLVPVRMTIPRFQNRLFFVLSLLPRMIVDVVTITFVLLRRNPDVLHITALYWRSIYREAYAVWLASLLRVPVLYDIRAGTFSQFLDGGSPLQRRLAIYVLRRSARVAIQGRKHAARLRSELGVEASWLPNCFLDADLDRTSPADPGARRPGDPFRLAFVGYLIPDKGVDVLLEAACALSRDGPVEVTLVGEVAPRFRATLERYQEVADGSPALTIRATGKLDFEGVLDHLQRQHVFVFLSRFFGEGHPNAVTEAMAMGLPVVASRQGFIEDVVTSDCGVIVDDPCDADAVAAVLAELRDAPDRLRAMGYAGRERIRTVFSASVVLRTTERLYRECAGSVEQLTREGSQSI